MPGPGRHLLDDDAANVMLLEQFGHIEHDLSAVVVTTFLPSFSELPRRHPFPPTSVAPPLQPQ